MLLLLVIVLILVFGWGGNQRWGPSGGFGGAGLILMIFIVLYLLGYIRL